MLVGNEGIITIAPGDELGKHITGVSYQLAPVPGGDALVPTKNGVVGIERKRADDLVNSWLSGRLSEQLGIMLGCYDHVVLCLEDTGADQFYRQFLWFDDPSGMFTRWQDDLLTFQEEGVRFRFTTSIEGTAAAVLRLKERYDKTSHGALYKVQKIETNFTQVRLLATPPGWGVDTAKSALKHLKVPIEVFNAPASKLEKIPLVTPRKIKLLFDAIGRIHGKRR